LKSSYLFPAYIRCGGNCPEVILNGCLERGHAQSVLFLQKDHRATFIPARLWKQFRKQIEDGTAATQELTIAMLLHVQYLPCRHKHSGRAIPATVPVPAAP
jgi:hypothetical protein